ncbi:MAG TPA: NrtA/SsuA/CpmA family ABC transporter substrate-binding protein [Pseudonocardiaceae bacterium]|nr:NrtA/SsuA/CpmA family ABC transporter substrate-binding protein [Pseudonocardiaceae bacterium]
MVREYSSAPHSARLPIAATAVLAATLMVSGCGVLNGGNDSADASQATTMSIRIGANPSIPSAALYIAQDHGLFTAQHLKVTVIKTTGGSAAVPALAGGSFDITTTNDATAISADVKGTPLKFVVDGIAATPGTFTLDSLPSSGIRSIKDLAGKTVGVSSPNDIPTLALKSELSANNVAPSSVRFVKVSFADAQQYLKNHSVDASVETEPYKTQSAQAVGARPVVDIFGDASGFANFPVSAYVTTAKYANAHPKEIAAFQRAMVAAANLATNSQNVKAAVLNHTKITATVADLMTLPRFPLDLDPKRLSRVVYMLQNAKLLKPDFQISSMILPLPAS